MEYAEYLRVDPESHNGPEELKLKTDVATWMAIHESAAEIVQDQDHFDRPASVIMAGYRGSPEGNPFLTQLWLIRGSAHPDDERVIIEFNSKRFELLPEKTKSMQTGEKMTPTEMEDVNRWLEETNWDVEASRMLAAVRYTSPRSQAPSGGWLRSTLSGLSNKH